MHSMSYKYGSQGRLKKDVQEQTRLKNLEETNYQKMLANLSEEHTRTKERLTQVQDHKYVLSLRSQIQESKQIIEELRAANKRHRNSQFGNEK